MEKQNHGESSDSKPMSPEELEKKKKMKDEKKKEKEREKELKKLKKQKKDEQQKLQSQNFSSSSKKKKNQKKDANFEGDSEHYIDPETPIGAKKRLSEKMATSYNPSSVEKSWYDWWKDSNFFQADPGSKNPAFTMILPPPNVTGALHIGHAFTAAIQDTIVRYKRMSGFNTLWIPGMDHAGIATQVVVEKMIMRETNRTRHDLGRKDFIEKVWEWKTLYGGTILKQLARLGASLDWSREFFTMDDKRSRAVTEAFVKLHKKGLIYRDDRLTSWDCSLRTAISDMEVEFVEIKGRTMMDIPGYEHKVPFGILTSFAYPIEGSPDEFIEVATTRVETMLGDTAIAVHPNDDRFKRFHGKFAIHPFNGRRIPIIQDEDLVEMGFGTGAVKITPSHDQNDFRVGKKHNLESIVIFTDDGRINSNGGKEFEGMLRFEARTAIIEALKKKGLHRECKDNEMRIGICSRSGEVIEPLSKPQWYLKCGGMAEKALEAAETGEMEILPNKYGAEWKRWLESIHDWCISRQIWWGHQIPAWYAVLEDDESKEIGSEKDHWLVSRDAETAEIEAKQRFPGKKIMQLVQDPDVLDTWFSSGLLPLSALGWPDKTMDFKTFYPTNVLETGFDILFFWVARMVMMGIELGDEKTLPFNKVYFFPMIRDKNHKKMSKSKGNVVDPLEVINGTSLKGIIERLENGNLDSSELDKAKEEHKKENPNGIPECGSDALRFALISYPTQSDGINLDIKHVVGYREWCNKLWNATRFALGKFGDDYNPNPLIYSQMPENMPFSCKWILSVLNKTITKAINSLEAFKFSDAAITIYEWWYELCDTFLEVIKPYFAKNDDLSARKHALDTLWVCFDTGLKLLHPFMPYITEELWQRLPSEEGRKESIMISDYPSPVGIWENDGAEKDMDLVSSVVKSLRSLIPLTEKRERRGFIACSPDLVNALKNREFEILTLASLTCLEFSSPDQKEIGAECAVLDFVDEKVSVFLEIKRCSAVEAQCLKVKKKIEETQKQKDDAFSSAKIAKSKDKEEKLLASLDQKLESLNTALRFLSSADQ